MVAGDGWRSIQKAVAARSFYGSSSGGDDTVPVLGDRDKGNSAYKNKKTRNFGLIQKGAFVWYLCVRG